MLFSGVCFKVWGWRAFLSAVVPVEFFDGQVFFAFSVVDDEEGFCVSERARAPVPGGAGDGFGGVSSCPVLERFVVQAVPVSRDQHGDAFEHSRGQRHILAFPGSQAEPQRPVQGFQSVMVVYVFQRADSADVSGGVLMGDIQLVDVADQMVDHRLLAVAGFHMGDEHLIRDERLNVLLLFREDMRFFLVLQVIVNHAPNRCVAGS